MHSWHVTWLIISYNPAAHEMLAKVSRRSISFITSWPARLYYIGVRHYAFYSISRAKRIRDVADEFFVGFESLMSMFGVGIGLGVSRNFV